MRNSTLFRRLIQVVLATPGVLFLVTRFAGSRLRQLAFDGKYESGKWSFLEQSANSEIVDLVKKYLHKGTVLSVGCGPGTLASALGQDSYREFYGIDVSAAAIEKAKAKQLPNAVWETQDMITFNPNRLFDLVLFEESLYYVDVFRRNSVLRRYVEFLNKDGFIIVTVAHPGSFRRLLNHIREGYAVVESGRFLNSAGEFVVFEKNAISSSVRQR